MGAILRAYEAAKAVGEHHKVPFALAGSHWLTEPNGDLVLNSDGTPHTYWDCKFVLQTTLDSGRYMRDGIRYMIEFFGGYDGVWLSRTESLESLSKPLSCRYYGFNVGDSPHQPFFGYDYRGQEYTYDDVCGDYKEFRQQNAYKEISVWECFDTQMLLNLVNGNWNKFLGNRNHKQIKPCKSHIRMAKAIKQRLIKTLLYHEVIEKKGTEYVIHWSRKADFAVFEHYHAIHSLPYDPQRNAGIVRVLKENAKTTPKVTYNYVGIQRKDYPMKRRPTLEELRRLMNLDSCKSVQSLMVQNGFNDTYN